MPRNLRFILSTAILVAGSYFLVGQWKLFQHIPKNYEWNGIQNFLEGHAADDDLLLFEPPWLVGYAQVHGRLYRYSVVTLKEAAQKTYPPSSQLWLLSMLNDSAFKVSLKKAGFRELESRSIFSIHLSRYEVPSKGALYVFDQNLQGADTFIDYGDGKFEKAEWKSETWTFKSGPQWWNQIEIRTVSFRRQMKRRCIWVHPLEEGIKTLTYSSVPLGKRIELFGGIADSGVVTPPGAPVYLFIDVGGNRVASLEFRDTDTAFYRAVDTSAFAGSNHQVKFQVHAANQGWRHFCFNAWSVKE